MNKEQLNPAKGIRWDLSNLYTAIEDPSIKKDQHSIKKAAEKFSKKYRNEIKSGKLSNKEFSEAIQEYERILNKVYILGSYAGLLQAKNATSDRINKLFSSIEEFSTEIQTILMFFDLEILEIPEKKAIDYLASDELKNYHQFLIRIRKFRVHTLKENEEILVNKKNQTGKNAFIRLYDQLSSELIFEVKIKGKIHEYNYSEVTNILSNHESREVRESAAKAITKTYKDNSKTFGFILNTLLLDKKTSDEIRKYEYPQHATFLGDEISKNTVESMTNAIEKRYDISEEFYLSKSKILGTKLHEWDRYSSIYPEIDEPTYSYTEAKDIILNSFEEFSPLFSDIANRFFENNWIDAEISKGKKSGAFCSYIVPGKHPVILTNFTGKANDVRTLAHELGHGIHAYLSREQSLLNYWPVTPFAEIASIFCETIVFNKIYSETHDKKQKINLLGGRLQEIFATIFRQNAFYLFESDIHQKRRISGELSVDEFNSIFQKRVQQMFGKGLELSEGHNYWWQPVAHFFHYNFYVFSYAFGQSLTNALYAQYEVNGKDFVKKYIQVLKLGSSKDLKTLTKQLGVDINKTDFWNGGLDIVEALVQDFKQVTY